MGRLGFTSALLALLLVVVIAGKSESNSTGPPNVPTTPATVVNPDENSNKTKEGVGKGYGGHRRHNNNGYGEKKHRGHRKNHDDDYDAFPYSKPYFDTHYCSVHGSFRLAYNEKSEKKENIGYQQQEGGYGNSAGSYGNSGGSYGSTGGSYGNNNGGSYGNKGGSYGEHKNKPHYVRKITRQYCRYAAAWSEKACKFCCKVVARSAYTNPDDIIAAIFSFDPSDPSSGGAGVESYGKHHEESNEYGHEESSYGKQEGGYGKQEGGYGSQGGYENQGGYDNQQGYGGQGNYNQGGGSNYGGGQSYGQQQQQYSPPQYGSGPYRAKRNSGYSQAPAPAYGAPPQAPAYDQYQQSAAQYQQPAEQYQQPAEQYQAPSTDQYSATPDAYSTKPDNGNKYENNPSALNQCVCCAPKHRYY